MTDIPAETAQHILAALQGLRAATITAAVVGRMTQPVSIEQVLELERDVYFALYPNLKSDDYNAWKRSSEQRLKHVQE
jgi:hypothetical protein